MHPVLVGTVRAYPLFLGLGVVVGALLALAAARRAGIPLRAFVGPYAVMVGLAIVGAKVHSVLERGTIVDDLAWELTHGFRYPGGIVATIAGAWLVRHSLPLSLAALADLLAVPVAFSTATNRIGCFLVGCCGGTVSALPWAVRFPRESEVWQHQVGHGLIAAEAGWALPVHPLQLYFLVFSATAGALALWWQGRKRYDGQVALVFLAIHEGGRCLLEFLRDIRQPDLQLVSLGLAATASALLLVRSRVYVKPADAAT